MIASLQARIDAMAYPPTHTYRLMLGAPPVPTGVLAERWNIIRPIVIDNHRNGGIRLLDVGCSKGFFSLRLGAAGWQVEALDTDPDAVALCRDLGIAVRQYSFREWPPPEHRFDLVFAGNVNHYCYQEAGWTWVRKLAAVTADGGTVIVEGPTDVIRDILTMTPRMSPDRLVDFTWPAFQREMAPWFELVSKVPTVGYTPERYITVWRRRETLRRDIGVGGSPTGPTGNVLASNTESGSLVRRVADELLKAKAYAVGDGESDAFSFAEWVLDIGVGGSPTGPTGNVLASNTESGSLVVGLDGEEVAKVNWKPTPALWRSVEFACVSTYDTPRVCNIERGWIEPRVTPDARFAPGWRQRVYSAEMRDLERAAFRAACLRNAELARMGMVDVDMGPANWFNDGSGWRTFDKNSIWPIATLAVGELGPAGRFLRTLEWASNPIAVPIALRAGLAEALATRNSVTVELTFTEAAEEIGMWP